MTSVENRYITKKGIFFASKRYSFVFLSYLLLLIILAAGGGSARPDVWSLLYVRPISIILIITFLIFLNSDSKTENPVIFPFLLLALLAGYMLCQLIPLPPSVWRNLPGHDRYADAADLAGTMLWRPISLTPRLTWNSLLALAIPAAVFIALAKGAGKFPRAVVTVWLLIGLLCLLLGLIQAASPDSSPLYLYKVSNRGLATGLFANRNHDALFLASMLLIGLAWIKQQYGSGRRPAMVVQAIIAVAALLIGIGILATGSRAGVILGCCSGVLSLVIYFTCASPARRSSALFKLVLPSGLGILAIAIFLIASGDHNSVMRVLNVQAYSEDLRLIHASLVQSIAHDFFPFGSGFGSFDPVFRGYEPDATLSPNYFNHAHNDLLELLMTGGLPASCIAGAMTVWWLSRSIQAWRSRSTISLVGAAIILLFAGASVVDYPLRTPLAAALFATACWWLGQIRAGVSRDEATQNGLYASSPDSYPGDQSRRRHDN